MNSLYVVLPILLILMFCLGLELRLSDFTRFRADPKALIIGLVGQLVFLPLVGFISIQMFDLPASFAAGVLLISCCPGGSSSNAFTMLARGNVALSVSLTAISSVVTVFSLPVLMPVLVDRGLSIDLPIGGLFVQNVVFMVVPLGLGMILRGYRSELALRLALFIKRYALYLLLLLVTIFFVENRAIVLNYFGEVGFCVLVLLLGSMFLGAILSKVFTLVRSDRTAIVIEIGMQNAAQAIALATSPFVFNSREMAVPAVIYALLMNVVLLLYVQYLRFRAR